MGWPVPPDQQSQPRSVAGGPPEPPAVPFLDAIGASFRDTAGRLPGRTDAELNEHYRELGRTLAQNQALDQAQEGYAAGGVGDPRWRDRVWADWQAAHARDPQRFPVLGKSQEEYDAGLIGKMRQSLEADARTVSRSGTVPYLIGSIGGGLTDPWQLATMAVGWGEATLFGRVAMNAALNSLTVAGETPFINQELKRQGRPEMTGGEIAMNVGGAAILGAAFPVAIHGAGKLAGAGARGAGAAIDAGRGALERAIADNWDRLPAGVRERWQAGATIDGVHLADLTEAIVGRSNMSEGELAAVDVLRREGELADASPFEPTGAGINLHQAAVKGAMDLVLGENIPAVPREPRFVPPPSGKLPATPIGDTALGTGTIAGDAQSRFMSKVRGVESGGRDAVGNPNSSAFGRYQFTAGTWLRMFKRRFGASGLSDREILARRSNGNLQDQLMADLTASNAAVLRANGAPVTEGNLYLAHFAGAGGATRVLRADPATPLSRIFDEATLAANPFMREWTAADLRAWAARKMGSADAEMPALARVDPDAVGDDMLAAQLQAETNRLQVAGAEAKAEASRSAITDDGALRDAPDLSIADDVRTRFDAAIAVEEEAKANALGRALDGIGERDPVEPVRQAESVGQARTIARQEIVGRTLTDANNTIEVVVSRKNMEKMGSESARANSSSSAAHAQALANIDHLFAAAEEYHSGPDLKAMKAGRDPQASPIGKVRQFIAAMQTPEGPVAVRMVVKDMRKAGEQNPLYTLQTIHVGGGRPDGRAPVRTGIGPAEAIPAGHVGPEPQIGAAEAESKISGARGERPATGDELAALADDQRAPFLDPAGDAARLQVEDLLHDARAHAQEWDDPELKALLDTIDADDREIDAIRGCL